MFFARLKPGAIIVDRTATTKDRIAIITSDRIPARLIFVVRVTPDPAAPELTNVWFVVNTHLCTATMHDLEWAMI